MVTKKVCYIYIELTMLLLIIAEVFQLEFNVIDIGLCFIAIIVGIVYFVTKVTTGIVTSKYCSLLPCSIGY